MQTEASTEALKAIRERIIKLEQFSNRGFGVHCFTKAQLVNIKAWNVELDHSTGLSKAGKNAKVELVHEVTIDESMTNNHDTLHGAYQALLLDGLSSSTVAALAVGSTWQSGGVSTDFQLRFLNPGIIGTKIKIISTTMKQGARLAVIDIRIEDAATGKLIMVGSHTKADIPENPKARL